MNVQREILTKEISRCLRKVFRAKVRHVVEGENLDTKDHEGFQKGETMSDFT